MSDIQKMNPEIKARWLDALRSGKYKQTDGRLREKLTNKMCCLGVLCDIMHPERWSEEALTTTSVPFDGDYDTLPPDWLCEEAGLDARRPSSIFDDDKAVCRLYTMNDNGYTFSQIADWIEGNL